MILIAPDKFKGTISASRAAEIIAQACRDTNVVKLPMADGGEGTAKALCQGPEWQERDSYYVNVGTRTAVIDSSAVIGARQPDLLMASSAPLGVKVREILQGGCQKVIIGVGGTATCDAGVGFLLALGPEKYETYRDKLIGLCDVSVPLLPSVGDNEELSVERMKTEPSALMFAAQKGAYDIDFPVLYRRLKEAKEKYGHGRSSQFDGAGGGMGFALATAIGAPCYPGAEFVLDAGNVRWSDIDFVITGEGCIDAQTSHGKVVDIVSRAAAVHGVPCVAIGGTVKDASGLACRCVATDDVMPDAPLTPEIAESRLSLTAQKLYEQIVSAGRRD